MSLNDVPYWLTTSSNTNDYTGMNFHGYDSFYGKPNPTYYIQYIPQAPAQNYLVATPPAYQIQAQQQIKKALEDKLWEQQNRIDGLEDMVRRAMGRTDLNSEIQGLRQEIENLRKENAEIRARQQLPAGKILDIEEDFRRIRI